MASNYKQRGDAFSVQTSAISPATFNVGDPVIVGDLPAIAMQSRTSTTTRANTTIWTYGIYDNLEVSAAISIVPGDIIYIDSDGDLSDTVSGGKRWGYALESKSAGPSNIRVKVGY